MKKARKTYLISAMHSGSGKTVFTYGFLQLLLEKGLHVQSFKSGPDYIDTMYHSFITRCPCINLDPFFLEPSENDDLRKLFLHHTKDVDVAVIEGAMGYFDGVYKEGRRASASVVADECDAEVVFLLDAKKNPTVKEVIEYLEGFVNTKLYQKPYQNRVKYMVMNRCSKEKYQEFSKEFYDEIKPHEALQGIQFIGFLPESEKLFIGSRHLGLHTPDSKTNLNTLANTMQSFISKNLDLEVLSLPKRDKEPPNLCVGMKDENTQASSEKDCCAMQSLQEEEYQVSYSARKETSKDLQSADEGECHNLQSVSPRNEESYRIAIARDFAFCFFYEDNLDLLKRAGFSVQLFSPLTDAHLPRNIDLLWLPGGYPELFAKQLSENVSLRKEIQTVVKAGLPTIAECGGFMYLHTTMEDMTGNEYNMCDVISARAFKTEKLQRFGYVYVEAKKDTLLLKQGEITRGHEFHYFDSSSNGDDALAMKANGLKSWDCVHGNLRLFAGFLHVYLRSNTAMLKNILEGCREFRQGRRMQIEEESAS